MTERWRFKLFMGTILAILLLFLQSLSLCFSLNTEGLALLKFRDGVVRDPFGALSDWNDLGGEVDPCSWIGVECSEDGKVVILNLKDLCLEGTLAPELGKLTYIKLILLDNNNFNISPELYELQMLSEFQVDENQLTSATLKASCNSKSCSWNTVQDGNVAQRRLLQHLKATIPPPKVKRDRHSKRGSELSPFPSISLSPSPSSSPSPSPSPLPSTFSPSVSPSNSPFSSFPFPPSGSKSLPPDPPQASPPDSLVPSPSPRPPTSPPSLSPSNPPLDSKPPVHHSAPWPSPASTHSQNVQRSFNSKHHTILLWSGVTVGSLFVFISALGIFYFPSNKVITVKPWATGLSGQLQKAFVTGVPKLQRSELEAACEDFSNIIGSISDGTVYKGTLSSGVEIAVTSTAVKSAEDWSKNLEAQYRKKIETLSKVNHKNFVSLIGFCEEEMPFTRMMVFEYAPNGTLFEHLHIKESEHLDWGMRLRIAMGMAYCLEHMHQLTPPIAHGNLQSSSIYLTEDYAAKISDFSFWNDLTATNMGSAATELLEAQLTDPESNVYSFGVILFEMVTGRLPYLVDNGSVVDWASDYLNGEQPLREMVDPTLKSFQEEELEKLFQVIKDCVNPDPKHRPTMKEVTARLKEITAMGPDGATPKSSPLWWAELEILSTEGS
ncbi:hypothetical protein ACSBR1_002244 [Camellia fascicularis]